MNAVVSALLLALFVGIALIVLDALGYHVDLGTVKHATQSCVEVVYNSGLKEVVCH